MPYLPKCGYAATSASLALGPIWGESMRNLTTSLRCYRSNP